MTLAELDLEMPNGNGFHDACITSLTINYPRCEMTLGMRLLLGGPDDPFDPNYRDATIKITGLKFCVVEPPSADQQYGVLDGEELDVVGFETKSSDLWINAIDQKLLDLAGPEAPLYSFFVQSWNSCIHIAAIDATHEWADGKQ